MGGRIVGSGRPQGVVTGPAEEAWDKAFTAGHPNAAAFLEMVVDPPTVSTSRTARPPSPTAA